MVTAKGKPMGRILVDVELANYDDMARAEAGDIPADRVRRLTVSGVVDTGATRLVIPQYVVDRLGLRTTGQSGVRYADGRTADRPVAGAIHLTWGGRSSLFSAIVEPDRDSALIGAIVLEDLDLVVDCQRRILAPRDPKRTIFEAE
jgi:predicted aspartyl protease